MAAIKRRRVQPSWSFVVGALIVGILLGAAGAAVINQMMLPPSGNLAEWAQAVLIMVSIPIAVLAFQYERERDRFRPTLEATQDADKNLELVVRNLGGTDVYVAKVEVGAGSEIIDITRSILDPSANPVEFTHALPPNTIERWRVSAFELAHARHATLATNHIKGPSLAEVRIVTARGAVSAGEVIEIPGVTVKRDRYGNPEYELVQTADDTSEDLVLEALAEIDALRDAASGDSQSAGSPHFTEKQGETSGSDE